MSNKLQHLLILGCGYVGERLASAAISEGIRISATTRDTDRAAQLSSLGIESVVADSPSALSDLLLNSVNGIIDSIPLSREQGRMYASQPLWLPVLAERAAHIRWGAYLSTTGVYGDADGAWVDESFDCHPTSPRGIERLHAEQAWLQCGLPAEVFRLAGIYGPGRNILDRLQAGGYQAVQWQPPHYSSRIHVDDIVAALLAAMRQPKPGRIMNLADDYPLPHADYACEVARMIHAPQPKILDQSEGEAQLPAALLDFFRDSKRISNRLMHKQLVETLRYPDFHSGINSLITQK